MARKEKYSEPESRAYILPNITQKILVQSIINNSITLVSGSAGTGKLNPDYTEVMTPDKGYVRIDSLKIGDFVMGQDGLPTKVIGIYPQQDLSIYELTFSDGTKTRCCEDHLWNVKSTREKEFKTRSLKEMLPKIQKGRSSSKKAYFYEIPICKPLELKEKELKLDPYLLGYALGDGHIRHSGYLELSIWEQDYPHFYEIFKDIPFNTHKYDSVMRLTTKAFNSNFKDLNLNGCISKFKFIPNEYLYSSKGQRLALLRGLMDTDGSIRVSATGSKKISYSSTSPFLIKGVKFLVQSLGGLASETRLVNRPNEYALNIRLPDTINPFLLPRKADKFSQYKRILKITRKIVSAEYIGQENGRCILVDNSNHLFLLNDCIVTHNTLFSIQTLYKLFKSQQINQILIVRLILENRYENIGALPGTEKDKLMPYLMPVIDNLELFLPQGEIDYLINKDLIKVVPISFLRGRTFSNKGIIVEESQNLNEHEIMTTATRLGEGSRMIFNGDDSQHDLDCRFGIHYLTQLFTDIEGIGIVKFNNDNISRHPLIEKILARQKEIKGKNAIKNT